MQIRFGGTYGTKCKQLKQEAQDYAESLTTGSSGEDKVNLSITDKTEKDNLSVGDTSDYVRIGPFQYKFTGKLQDLKVKCDGEYLSNSNFRLIKYRGSKAEVIKASDIKSKDKFYVDVSKKIDIQENIGLKLEVGTSTEGNDVYKARIWLIKAGGYQNLLHCVTSGTELKPDSISNVFVYDVPHVGLRLKKVDDRDETKPLEGVGFTFSTEIKVWELANQVTDTKPCTHYHKGYYDHTNDGKDSKGNIIPCTHYNPPYYDHKYDEWTRNIYEPRTRTVYLDESGKWSYSPYVWRTNSKGEIPIDNITYNTISTTITNEKEDGEMYTKDAIYLDKTYVTATEVDNPHYGYQNEINHSFKLKVGSTGELEKVKLTNHQKYVKLSGYVWLDEGNGKTTLRNDEFDSDFEKGIGEKDGKNGIKVYLIDKNGNKIKSTITSEVSETNSNYRGKDLYPEINGGEYIFEDVDLDKLEAGEYHIEFEYCGIKYQAVASDKNINNGSKAEETVSRDILNKKFASVNGEQYSTSNGKPNLNVYGVGLTYNNISNHESTPIDHEKGGHTGCEVYASTKTDSYEYDLFQNFEATKEEIRYINLGLFEKEQTDYGLVQDLYNVRVGVNDFYHIYRYANVRYDGDNIKEDSWNVGVKFQNNRGTYNRAIYTSDIEYKAPNHIGNELKVYATYKVALKNQSPYMGSINNIVDYCDIRAKLVAAGTLIDNEDKITGNIGFDQIKDSQGNNYNINGYSKYVIYTNQIMYAGEEKYIYLQFEMDREAVLSLINDGQVLNNVAEINSYTTFDDNNPNKPIAVIDTDSIPGNTIPGNINTYEDDTDAARSLKLELKNARAISGTVFVDSTDKDSNQVYTNKERIGNGIFDNGEKTLSGVTVTLREIGKDDSSYDNERKVYTTTTDENGNFNIVGYIPGNYELTYTWGNKDYKVQYYKGTIYDSTRKQDDPYWYRGSEKGNDTISINNRKTDALDSKDIRTKIEQEMNNIKINTLESEINKAYENGSSEIIKTTKMDSSTPAMAFSVEYETTITDGNADQVVFTVRNVDFGIVERAKQALDFSKRVSGYKITLANGQVLVDATIGEDGKITGTQNYTTYLKPSVTESGIINIGQLKTEMDNELIEGATLETTYTMKVTNVGELDYSTEDYYYYGKKDDSKKVTVSVTELLDYVDGRLNNVDADKQWKETDQDHLNKVNASWKVYENINKYRTYLTDKLSKSLVPGESNTVNLYTSKLLTSTDDNTFNNKSEISEVTKNTGFTIGTPVKLINNYFNIGDSEKIVIIPSTGENKDYILPIVIGITAITILGLGIILIKKFVIDKK